MGRQREDLEGAAVKCQEILFHESIPCQDELIHTDPQKGGDLVIAVERQAAPWDYRIKLLGRVHLCKHLPTALLVPALLQESIALNILRVIPPVPSPVIPVLLHPALLAFLLVLAVVRGGLHLLVLPAPFPQTPALFLAAIPLVLYTGIGNKRPAAVGVGTSDLLFHSSPFKETTMTLFRTPLSGEKEESDQKKISFQKSQGKNIHVGIS